MRTSAALHFVGSGATADDACSSQNDRISGEILSFSVAKIHYIKDVSHCYTEVANTCASKELRQKIEKLRYIEKFAICRFVVSSIKCTTLR